MQKINYNRFFHLHTVSGIVISVGLYVIFFAGAFALFMEPTKEWEQAKSQSKELIFFQSLDYDRVLDSLDSKYDLYGRDMSFHIEKGYIDHIDVSATKDTSMVDSLNLSYELDIDQQTYSLHEHKDFYSLGDLLYTLHFFRQAGSFGYYLSGFVALFFLFAIISGVVIHWKKIVSNFFIFRTWAKLKTIWTDAHTALGVIGLPFQFMYALTGAFLVLGILIAPALLLFDGDVQLASEELGFVQEEEDTLSMKSMESIAINSFLMARYADFVTIYPGDITITNCKSATMKIKVTGFNTPAYNSLIDNYKIFEYDYATGIEKVQPKTNAYVRGVRGIFYYLHVGEYGDLGLWKNILLKVIYFILAFITAFVIITGVLIWLEARKKLKLSDKQRRFNKKVGHWYLAICLSMFPITAISFILAKVLPSSLNDSREFIFNCVFFGGWLLLSIFYRCKRNNAFVNRSTLLLGGILSLCIPVINGVISGYWPWKSVVHHPGVFIIDMLWLSIGLASIYALYRMRKGNSLRYMVVSACKVRH